MPQCPDACCCALATLLFRTRRYKLLAIIVYNLDHACIYTLLQFTTYTEHSYQPAPTFVLQESSHTYVPGKKQIEMSNSVVSSSYTRSYPPLTLCKVWTLFVQAPHLSWDNHALRVQRILRWWGRSRTILFCCHYIGKFPNCMLSWWHVTSWYALIVAVFDQTFGIMPVDCLKALIVYRRCLMYSMYLNEPSWFCNNPTIRCIPRNTLLWRCSLYFSWRLAFRLF